jgi:hypothetical protein
MRFAHLSISAFLSGFEIAQHHTANDFATRVVAREDASAARSLAWLHKLCGALRVHRSSSSDTTSL